MKKHVMPEMKEGGVNVTPLIDIVMCLIIFFMLVAKIGVTRGDIKSVALPKTILGKEIKDFSNTLTLNILPTNTDDPQVSTLVDGVPRDIKIFEHLGGQTDRPLLRILKEFKSTHTDPKVIIRADKDLPYSQLESVLLSCAEAEVSNIAYETKEGTEKPESADAPPGDAPAAP
jgi:biopolymer transport protein ExbD